MAGLASRAIRVAVIWSVVAGILVPAVVDAAPFRTGFFSNGDLFAGAGVRGRALGAVEATHGQLMRVRVDWSSVAPVTPQPGFRPDDSADPAYRWGELDAIVRDVRSRGLEVILTIDRAPAWAEGPDRASRARPGTWRPDPAAFGAFARAAAHRYSGDFADPDVAGTALPRVRYWQAWNEPNITLYLNPQWSRTPGGSYRPESPHHYRRLLNAFYDGVKAVRADNVVLSGGTAPYGQDPGEERMRPLFFLRQLFCLSDRLRRTACEDPPRLDKVAHHPYGPAPGAGPRRRAINDDDAGVLDVRRVSRVVRAAERGRSALPGGRKELWSTELAWDSRPPHPFGARGATFARWVSDSQYLLWRQGVETIIWLVVRDFPRSSSTDTRFYGSGAYFANWRPKPARQAFRFPFVAERRRRGRVYVWGRAPRSDRVAIQQRIGQRWRTQARLRTDRSGVFSGLVRVPAHRGALRASVSGEESLSRSVGR
jgi:hypothetical protein